MSLGLYETRQRQRAKRRWATVKTVLFLILLGVTAAVSFEYGTRKGGEEVEELSSALAMLQQRTENLQASEAEAQEAAEAARAEAAQWESRYRAEVPEGFYEEMLGALREKRASGVSEERLSFLINTAEDVEACSEETQTKRFLVRTPISQGANDSIAFGDGAITVTAAGESARAANGAPEAWYDPDKPIALTITTLGGAEETVDGLLPLHHALVEGDREYRFSARAGSRGFLEVTSANCAFP